MILSPLKEFDSKKWLIAPVIFAFAALSPEYIAPVLAVFGLVYTLRQKKSGLNRPAYFIIGYAILIYIGWMIIGLTYTDHLLSGAANIVLWLFLFSGLWICTQWLDSYRKIDVLIYAGCIAGGLCGLIGILQMVLFHCAKDISLMFNPFYRLLDLYIERLINLLPDIIINKFPSTHFHTFAARACGTFSNPLFFATYEIMMMPFAAYCFLNCKKKYRRIIGFFSLIFIIGGVACSYSRGPYLACTLTFAILLSYGGKKSLKMVGTGMGLLAFALVFAGGVFKRLFTLTGEKDVSVSTRELIWAAVADKYGESPVFGFGTGFETVRRILSDTYGIKQPHAHNILLEILLENGVIGVLLFIAACMAFCLCVYKLIFKNSKSRSYAITFLASFAGFFMCGMTDCVFYGFKPLEYMMLILGVTQACFNISFEKDDFKKTSDIFLSLNEKNSRR